MLALLVPIVARAAGKGNASNQANALVPSRNEPVLCARQKRLSLGINVLEDLP